VACTDWPERLAITSGREDFLCLETMIEARILQALRELQAKSFCFGEHANEPAFHWLGRPSQEFRLSLDFAAALGRRFAQCCAQHGFVQAKLLGQCVWPTRSAGYDLEFSERKGKRKFTARKLPSPVVKSI